MKRTRVSTYPSISGTAIIRTGLTTVPITATGATGNIITGRTITHATDIIIRDAIRGGIIQGTATSVTGVTGITDVIAATTVRVTQTLFAYQQKRGQRNADPCLLVVADQLSGREVDNQAILLLATERTPNPSANEYMQFVAR